MMTEIEKKAEAYALVIQPGALRQGEPMYTESDVAEKLEAAYLAGAAAVIELIRERMPEKILSFDPYGGRDRHYAIGGRNGAIDDVHNILNSLTENIEDEKATHNPA